VNTLPVNSLIVGLGSAALALVLAVFVPVSRHQVNQTLIGAVIAVLVFAAAFSLFDLPLAALVAVAGTAAALLLRALARWMRETLYHHVLRYTRRDYWYRRVGRAVLGSGRRRRS
jgi:hypothetical protein